MTVRLALSAPIQAHGAEVKELVFRKPLGGDISRCGVPFKIEIEGGVQRQIFDARVIAEYVSTLAAVPSPSVEALAAEDFMAAMGVVLGFFGSPAPATSSTGAGS